MLHLNKKMHISLKPVIEQTHRKCKTTQLEIQIDEWKNDIFCLWMPESVSADFDDRLWSNTDSRLARQEFSIVRNDRIKWDYRSPRSRIVCDLEATDSCLYVTCSIANESDEIMRNAYVQNCLHFPKAPSFSDKAGETVYFRCDGKWVPMSSTKHWFNRSHRSVANTTKFFFREAALPRGRHDFCKDKRNVGPERSDHPLVIKVSKGRQRSVGIAGGNWDFVFHNANPVFGCIHSQPLPVELKPMQEKVFKQRIYFCNGDHKKLICEFAGKASTV